MINSVNFNRHPLRVLCIFLALLILTSACTTKNIQGTQIEDSDETREVMRTVEMYRKAMESRNADMLIALAGRNYFEKNGDSTSGNNYDYEGLVQFLRSPAFRRITSVRMEIVYKNVDFSESRNVATVRYHFKADFKIPPTAYGSGIEEEEELVAADRQASSEDQMAQKDDFDKEIWHSKADENEMILEKDDGRWYILKGM